MQDVERFEQTVTDLHEEAKQCKVNKHVKTNATNLLKKSKQTNK